MFSLNKSKLFHMTELVFAKKWGRVIPVVATVILIYITDKIIVNFFNSQIAQNNQKFIVTVIFTNFTTTAACIVGSYILISSAMRRESHRHFFNVASIYFGTFIALLGTNILAMDYILVAPSYKTLTLAINLITAFSATLIAGILYSQKKEIVNLPDLIELMEAKEQLEHELKVLKSTHPHLSAEEEASSSEILSTLKKASTFLDNLDKK